MTGRSLKRGAEPPASVFLAIHDFYDVCSATSVVGRVILPGNREMKATASGRGRISRTNGIERSPRAEPVAVIGRASEKNLTRQGPVPTTNSGTVRGRFSDSPHTFLIGGRDANLFFVVAPALGSLAVAARHTRSGNVSVEFTI